MRTFRLIAVTLVFAAIFAVSAFAQTPTQQGDKIGLVAWQAFDDAKTGITKYATAIAALDKEFEPMRVDLQTMTTKYTALQKELQGFQDLINSGKPIPIAQTEVQRKVDELSQLERDIKKKQEDAKAKYQSRFNVVVAPIEGDILKALSEYAAQKGYAVIFDGGKLEQAGVLLGWAPKADVTKDFITFYNARPATTATTVPVKK